MAERQRPFPCTTCDHRFPTQKRLKVHLKYHQRMEDVREREREAKCGLCDKAYVFKHELKRHLTDFHNLTESEARKSSGVKSFRIPIILPGQDIIYFDRPRLSCTLCHRKYAYREYFDSHLMRVHGKTEEEAKEITGLELETQDTPGDEFSGGSRRKKNVLHGKAETWTWNRDWFHFPLSIKFWFLYLARLSHLCNLSRYYLGI